VRSSPRNSQQPPACLAPAWGDLVAFARLLLQLHHVWTDFICGGDGAVVNVTRIIEHKVQQHSTDVLRAFEGRVREWALMKARALSRPSDQGDWCVSKCLEGHMPSSRSRQKVRIHHVLHTLNDAAGHSLLRDPARAFAFGTVRAVADLLMCSLRVHLHRSWLSGDTCCSLTFACACRNAANPQRAHCYRSQLWSQPRSQLPVPFVTCPCMKPNVQHRFVSGSMQYIGTHITHICVC
jgi:hypothetical protein